MPQAPGNDAATSARRPCQVSPCQVSLCQVSCARPLMPGPCASGNLLSPGWHRAPRCCPPPLPPERGSWLRTLAPPLAPTLALSLARDRPNLAPTWAPRRRSSPPPYTMFPSLFGPGRPDSSSQLSFHCSLSICASNRNASLCSLLIPKHLARNGTRQTPAGGPRSEWKRGPSAERTVVSGCAFRTSNCLDTVGDRTGPVKMPVTSPAAVDTDRGGGTRQTRQQGRNRSRTGVRKGKGRDENDTGQRTANYQQRRRGPDATMMVSELIVLDAYLFLNVIRIEQPRSTH